MTTTHEVDVVLLGVGSGGELAARRLARAGLRVAAVESRSTSAAVPGSGSGPSATSPGEVPSRTSRSTRARSSCGTCSARTARGGEYHAVSRVTFTDPEVGSVGLTEAQAREEGLTVTVGTAEIDPSPRGWIAQATGTVKVVADAASGVVVGATTVAPYGGEVLGLLSTAVHARLTVPVLRRMHFAYPTFHRVVEKALRDTGL